MSIEDLREVIERPALLPDVRLIFDEDLVGDLLFDMHGQIGALPLLEFALDQLFHHRRERRLTRHAYQEIGGVRGAISKQAESTYEALPSDEHRRLARTLFMRLIQPSAQGQEPLRRRADISEFALENANHMRLLREVIDAFIAARLITVNQSSVTSTLEISHEALIREWPRLAQWIQEAREDIHVQQIISNDVLEWEHRGKPKDRLYRGSQLKEALAWQKRNIASGKEALFLKASTTRRTRGYINIALVALLVLAIAIPAGVIILQQFAPLTVTTLQDDAPGSLRQVITNAHSGNTIIISPNLKGTLELNRDLEISKNLTIQGSGTNQLVIGGQKDINGLIQIPARTTVTLSQLTFSSPTPGPGGIILNAGTLTLDKCAITGNTEQGVDLTAGNVSGGAGINNLNGILILQNSIISHNTTKGAHGFGAAIFNSQGTLTVNNSQIVDNSVITTEQPTNGSSLASGGGIANLQGKVTLIKTTIARNKVVGADSNSLNAGGGIFSENGTMTITNSTITNNSADGGQQGKAYGGGINNIGSTITITDSQILGNTVTSNLLVGTAPTNAVASGGGIDTSSDTSNGQQFIGTISIKNSVISNNTVIGHGTAKGGGIAIADGRLTLTGTTIAHNTAKSLLQNAVGGGIYNGESLTITDSVVSDNNAAAFTDKYIAVGGGIETFGTLNLNRTTIAMNTASNSKGATAGGGIFSDKGIAANTQNTLTNCTIADNKSLGANGVGGGFSTYVIPISTSMDFCTIYGNVASTSGGGIDGDATSQPGFLNLSIKNSIIAGNSAHTAPDISGNIITGGYNLVQSLNGTTFNDPMHKHTTDITGQSATNPGLDTQLRNNGGPTPTLALQTGSPALHAIPASACDATTDQRGVKRPHNNTCDIGAIES